MQVLLAQHVFDEVNLALVSQNVVLTKTNLILGLIWQMLVCGQLINSKHNEIGSAVLDFDRMQSRVGEGAYNIY